MDKRIACHPSYSQKTYSVAATMTGSYGPSIQAEIKSAGGPVIATGSLSVSDGFDGSYHYFGNLDFGLYLSEGGVVNNLTTSIPAGSVYSNWRLSHYTGLDEGQAAVYSAIETETIPRLFPLTKRAGSYSGVPLLITRGDSVIHGTIVGGAANWCQLSGTALIQGTNYVGELLTGPRAGQFFTVVSGAEPSDSDQTQSQFYADRGFSGLVGSSCRLMPRRYVTGYTPWTGDQASARFHLDQPLPTGSSTTHQAGSFYSFGSYQFASPFLTGSLFPATSLVVPEDTYGRAPAVGDLVQFTDAEDLTPATGLVVFTQSTVDGPEVYVYTNGPSVSLADPIRVHYSNQFTLESYPEPSSHVTACVSVDLTGLAKNICRTPDVSMQLVGNQFDSTYSGVSERLWFHSGPLVFGGDVLNETGLPCLSMAISIITGNQTDQTYLAKTGYSSIDASAGQFLDGSYYRDGVFTCGGQDTWTAAGTHTWIAKARYGSLVVNATIPVPVQPQ